MSAVSTVNTITTQTLTYVPAVAAGIQAAELSGAAGTTKQQAVVNAIIAGSAVTETSANPEVAGISALINLFVSIFNATGIFSHKSAAPVSTTTA